MLENSSKLIVKTPERHQWYRSGVSTVSFEQISHIFIVDFEQAMIFGEHETIEN